jgi:uncharacterized membrane protein YuzA (DUF378 family)
MIVRLAVMATLVGVFLTLRSIGFVIVGFALLIILMASMIFAQKPDRHSKRLRRWQ